MKSNGLIVLCIIAVIGAALFGDQVIALFVGMSPLESLQVIVKFILHVAVATIVSYVALTAPELFKPWMRTLRRNRRTARRQPAQIRAPREPRMNYKALFHTMLNQQNAPKPRLTQLPTVAPTQDESKLNF